MIISLVLSAFFATSTDAVIVETSKGSVRGYTSYDAGRFTPVHVFKGVPLAKPPIGDLRFELPQDADRWEGILEATEYSPACSSNTTRTQSPQENISEDCLYVNVFADKRCFGNRRTPCPVITYIHGGSFTYDSAVMFNDSQIIDKYASHELIFIIPAFRLGIFGFLDLGNDDTVMRNIGMYDIIHDLKWIKREIGNFGGDPNKITLMGNSAGGSAIIYSLLSPSVPEDAFQQGIVLSNAPDFQSDSCRIITELIVENIGCNSTDWTPRQVVECLKEKSSLELLGWQRVLENEKTQSFNGPQKFTPLFPGTYGGLLEEAPAKPLLIGVTKYEFTGERTEEYKEIYCNLYCQFFDYNTREAFDECMRFYTSDEYSGEFSVEGEAIHAISYRDAMVMARKGAPIYLSSFELTEHDSHAKDLLFAIGLHPLNRSMNEEEAFMDRYYPEVLRNFVKTGRPAENWFPLTQSGKGYFLFDVSSNETDLLSLPHQVNEFFYPNHTNFWISHLSAVNENAKKKPISSEKSLLLPVVSNRLMKLDSSAMSAQESLSSAFWVSLIVILILSAAILVMAISSQLTSRERARGYYRALDDMAIFGNGGKSGVVVYGATD